MSSLIYDPTFDGVMDMVLIDKHSRTVFGRFGQYFSGTKRWSQPDEEAIAASKIVALDPFFQEESIQVSQICARLGKPYVTIDSPPDSEIHKNASAIVVSNEFIQNTFKDVEVNELFSRYTEASNGLVIFTFGSREILFGRTGEPMKSIKSFHVDVKSTLGAGDTFRAGVVYGLLNNLNDEKTVKFAAATAGMVCTRFPFALNPPSKEEILSLANS